MPVGRGGGEVVFCAFSSVFFAGPNKCMSFEMIFPVVVGCGLSFVFVAGNRSCMIFDTKSVLAAVVALRAALVFVVRVVSPRCDVDISNY